MSKPSTRPVVGAHHGSVDDGPVVEYGAEHGTPWGTALGAAGTALLGVAAHVAEIPAWWVAAAFTVITAVTGLGAAGDQQTPATVGYRSARAAAMGAWATWVAATTFVSLAPWVVLAVGTAVFG